MKLSNTDLAHFKFVFEELLFRLKDDDYGVIDDLEDEIKICAEILGLNPNVEQDNDD